MENGFEKFIERNQERFEKGAPSPEVWQKLKGQLAEHHAKKTALRRRAVITWCVAACVVLLAGLGYVFYFMPHENKGVGIVKIVEGTKLNDVKKQDTGNAVIIKKLEKEKALLEKEPVIARKLNILVNGKDYDRSLVYYKSLVDNKQKELEQLQSTNPDLYASFTEKLDDLNVIFAQLKSKLPQSINREKILQQMIENRQMQAGVLASQLELVKKMQSSNNNSDEKS